jgi:xanthine/uracil permease
MLNNAQPLIFGAVGVTGVEIVASSSFNESLSIILQIIIAAGTLYKLYLDRNKRKNKEEI